MLLELVATSVGEGIVMAGFIAAGIGVATGQSRQELERDALRNGFWGGAGGILCLYGDQLLRYLG
jgi:hypothetical protein